MGTVDWRLVIDNEALASVLRGPSGPVYNDMLGRAIKVQTAAKNQVKLGTKAPGPRGHLKDSIVKRIMTNESGKVLVEIWVGSEHPRALLYHEGSKAHPIGPGQKVLAFRWRGKQVYFWSVNHPGTEPNRYLTDNIHLAKTSEGSNS